MTDITRRHMMAGLLGGTALSLTVLNACSAHGGKPVSVDNKDYYKPDGTFDEAKAKQAYYDMMAYYSYPIPDRLRGEEFWTLDFGLGQFSEVGMAGIFWVNNQDHNYMGHEIYLLPGQMIPEHWHVKTEDADPKLEAWHVRHGEVTLFAEGEPSPGVEERIPPLHRKIAVARKEQVVKPGDVGYLANAEERHSMLAGPEGAIVTEYATYHTMDALRFTHPDIKL